MQAEGFVSGEPQFLLHKETAKAAQKQEDLQADVAKHSSKLTQPPPDLSNWTARFRHFSRFLMDTPEGTSLTTFLASSTRAGYLNVLVAIIWKCRV